MAKEKMTVERDRNATEKKLLDTIRQTIAEEGFEKVGINAIASLSGGCIEDIDIPLFRFDERIDGCLYNVNIRPLPLFPQFDNHFIVAGQLPVVQSF